MPPIFDPAENLPPALQERFDAWITSPPRRQFQAYGPLTAYLQGHKFQSDRFLVKPQKLLREEIEEIDVPDEDDGEEEEDDGEEEEDDDEDDDDLENVLANLSIDSSGATVLNEPKGTLYPDFTVERYWGADNDDNPNPDVVRIVVEVGSFVQLDRAMKQAPRNPDAAGDRIREIVTRQLEKYMTRVEDRFDDRLLGVAMIGNEVALRVRTSGSHNNTLIPGIGTDWIRFDDPRFIQELDTIRNMV
ncbi:hypothetical protein BDZ89DRAFT_1077308 [Hymenopellis radicata]|nr:hypothetical protein BDZ89DRAFT_1077308 [Hymenopellis radicata]